MAAVAFVPLTIEVSKEGDAFVSRCLELGTASCGDTFEEALANVKEATLEYLNAIERLGERPRILREKGIVIRKTRPSSLKGEYRLHPDVFVGPYVAKIPLSA
jgi:predicted RNase H-like HicB family nuclease